MNDLRSGKSASQRRAVPGPRSNAIFEREAGAMAPGLQSIALYSQIVVDHALGCTITDVDGNEYLDFIAGIAVGSVGHCHPHYVKRIKEQLDRVTFGSFTTENRARFSIWSADCCQKASPISNFSRAALKLSRPPSGSPNRSARNSNSSAFGAAITARPRG